MESFEEMNKRTQQERQDHARNHILPTAEIAAACGGDDLLMALEMNGAGAPFAIESESEREAKAERLARLRIKSIREGKFTR